MCLAAATGEVKPKRVARVEVLRVDDVVGRVDLAVRVDPALPPGLSAL